MQSDEILLTEMPVQEHLHTFAFYNTENFFDIFDDAQTQDNDFLPKSNKRWTAKRYKNKLRKLSYTIANIGRKETGKHPALIGLAEVENAAVILDLIQNKHLQNCNYKFVHYNSKDERGIDVALVYDASVFQVLTSEKYEVELRNDAGLPDYTRDILLVSGNFNHEKIHVIVNHWSSRRDGEKETEHKRLAAANKVAEIISAIKINNPEAKIIIIGDFNDTPTNNSIKYLVDAYSLFNPMEQLMSFSRGTTRHFMQWYLFDQILFSTGFLTQTGDGLKFVKADIFDEDFLKLFNGKYKGSPYRTYIGKKYKGGYSDHFPVYAILKTK